MATADFAEVELCTGTGRCAKWQKKPYASKLISSSLWGSPAGILSGSSLSETLAPWNDIKMKYGNQHPVTPVLRFQKLKFEPFFRPDSIDLCPYLGQVKRCADYVLHWYIIFGIWLDLMLVPAFFVFALPLLGLLFQFPGSFLLLVKQQVFIWWGQPYWVNGRNNRPKSTAGFMTPPQLPEQWMKQCTEG